MWSSNPTWGAPRIQAELHRLGIEVSDSTVRRYRSTRPRPPSQTWRSFLENHLGDIAAMDFVVVPTATFRVLYVLVIMRHDRRRILHFNVTTAPNAAWTARQVVGAFPYADVPRFLLHDRDRTFAGDVARRARSIGIKEVLTAPGSPWQNAYCERLIGSIRRECLDHVVVLNERHLLRVLRSYTSYYHASRTHRALDGDAPDGRPVEPPQMGEVVVHAEVGGLHHRYARRAA
jgi:transposase InsO family protein